MKKIELACGRAALVDDEDHELVSKYRWIRYRSRGGASYARTRLNGRFVLMHRMILQPARGPHVHHVNDDGVDNRRANLRICTASEHGATHQKKTRNTSSSYKGVCWHRRDRQWRAQLMSKAVSHWLGSFKDELPAAFAYDDAARLYFGEFARPNFPYWMRRRNLRRWLVATSGRIMSLIFVKRSDGRYRRLTVRLGVRAGLQCAVPAYEPARKNLIVLFDMRASRHKAVPLESIQTVTCRGKKYRVI